MTICIAIGLIVMTCSVSRAAAKHTIDNPCGRRALADKHHTMLPLELYVRMTIGASRNLVDKCRTAMKAYGNQGLLEKDEVNMLDSPHSHVMGLEHRHRIVSTYPDLDQQLRQDYRDISTLFVYLQHAMNQQLAYDGNTMKTEFNDVKNAFLGVLCQLDSMLRQRETTVSHFVDSSVMPDLLKNIRSTKHRSFRDYLVLKDATLFLDSMIDDYEDILAQVLQEQN